MQSSDPLNTLSHAIQSALSSDLPDISWEVQGETRTRRPRRNELNIVMFQQDWPTTALGFDGLVAGQAFTSAYTVIVTLDRTACVYFAERLAYTADTRNSVFQEDLAQRSLEGQREARTRYKAITP